MYRQRILTRWRLGLTPIAGIVASSDHRQATPGGKDEQRTDRSPVGHSMASGRRIDRSDLSTSETFRDVVPQMVASLCGRGARWIVRSVACTPGGSRPHSAADRTHHCQHPTTAGSPCNVRHALPACRGADHPSRTQNLAGHTSAGSADYRACLAPTRLDQSANTNGTPDQPQWLSRTRRGRLKLPASNRLGGAGVLERPAPAVVHLCLQRCFRWRRTPEIGPFATDGRGPRVSDRGLAAPRPTRPSAIRQCSRILRLGQISPVSVARDSTVSMSACHADLHPTASPTTQWRCGELQRLVSTFAVPTSLQVSGGLAARTGSADDDGQRTAYPVPSRPAHGDALSAWQASAPIAGQVQSRHRSFAYFRRPRHFHSPSVQPWQDHPAGTNIQGRPVAQVQLRQSRLGYSAATPDGLCN